MGSRGPAPTPSRVLALHGSWRARLDRDEPTPEPGEPDLPDWLDEDAKAAWREVAPGLDAMGVLGKVDGHALAVYCTLFSRWRKAEAFLAAHGDSLVVKDASGRAVGIRLYPQVKLANQLAEVVARMAREFGLTPSARTRVRVVPAAPPRDPEDARYFGDG